MRAGEHFVNVIRVVSCCGLCLDCCSASRHRPAVSGLSLPLSRTQSDRMDPPLHPSQTVQVLPCGLSGLSQRTPCPAQTWNTQQHSYTLCHTRKPGVKTSPFLCFHIFGISYLVVLLKRFYLLSQLMSIRYLSAWKKP